ncbi:AcrR family transcriptional regulator [Oikeobacillus pervagus]|uniref:AcrR family transcriptional regulator n=1 Tax=Oikeobacillus pervagus TaxID=1325931 RepID=A0AAJ1T074_9BACI|nr:TetR/AcrR family transcriptional regulator [Oikeobacillus pervagus]MDQ0216094.1 AcrR family transcriptional regulator [Oikeobacillus pervagus]
MSPRKSVDEELSKEKIMDVARGLFVKEGYSNVSMRMIAKELNYSHGAIYYHFQNKAELFYAVVSRDFSLLQEELERILTLDLSQEEKLREVLLGFIRFGLNYQSHYEMMFLTKEEELRNYQVQNSNLVYEKFAQSLHLLSNRTLKLREIWSIFLAIHGFVAHYCGCGQSFEDVKGLANFHVDFVLKGILVD